MTEELLLREIKNVRHAMAGHMVFLYQDCIRRNAKHVVELGLDTGGSTIALLCAVQETAGHLTSVDIAHLPETMAKIKALGLGDEPRWTVVEQDDLLYAKERLGRFPPIDALLIDTSHEEEHTACELRAYAPLMASDGAIWMHDTELDLPPYPGQVREALNAWLPGSGWKIVRDFEHSNGLAVLERET